MIVNMVRGLLHRTCALCVDDRGITLDIHVRLLRSLMAKLLSYFSLIGRGCDVQGLVMLRFGMCPEFWLCLESFFAVRTQESFRSKPLRI